jgi:hypothetical protein
MEEHDDDDEVDTLSSTICSSKRRLRFLAQATVVCLCGFLSLLEPSLHDDGDDGGDVS